MKNLYWVLTTAAAAAAHSKETIFWLTQSYE
jgi:hypothetical protein